VKSGVNNKVLDRLAGANEDRTEMVLSSSHSWLLALVLAFASRSLCFRHDTTCDNTIIEDGSTPLLEVFQVYPPPLSPKDLVGSTVCSFTLMHHVFADSAGKPYIGVL
jgi:hypothetical protein